MIRILFATSELYPLVKTGGLADVSASLPEALCRLEYDVHILLPGYPAAMEAARKGRALRKTRIQVDDYSVSLWQTRTPGSAATLWLVDCPALFDRPGNPYQNGRGKTGGTTLSVTSCFAGLRRRLHLARQVSSGCLILCIAMIGRRA